MARCRVLTAAQVADMFFDSEHRARVRLVALHRLGVLDRFQPHRPEWGACPYHYVLGRQGAAIAAAVAGEDPERAVRRWRGERALALAHSQRLAHLLGINGVYAALVRAVRHGEGELVDWLTEAECVPWAQDHVRPDAFGTWRQGPATVEFFLEWARATETLARLAAKLARYEALEADRGGAAWVLFVFPSAGREAGARTALAGATVPVATAVAGGPPLDAVWWPLGAGAGRVRLVALAGLPKPPEALARVAAGRRPWLYERAAPGAPEGGRDPWAGRQGHGAPSWW